MVTLMPDCRTDTGKWGEGMLVSHSRKLLWTSDSASVRSLATSFSSSGIHDLTRWQFCKQTQCPAGVQRISASLDHPTGLTACALYGNNLLCSPTAHCLDRQSPGFYSSRKPPLFFLCSIHEWCSGGIAIRGNIYKPICQPNSSCLSVNQTCPGLELHELLPATCVS